MNGVCRDRVGPGRPSPPVQAPIAGTARSCRTPVSGSCCARWFRRSANPRPPGPSAHRRAPDMTSEISDDPFFMVPVQVRRPGPPVGADGCKPQTSVLCDEMTFASRRTGEGLAALWPRGLEGEAVGMDTCRESNQRALDPGPGDRREVRYSTCRGEVVGGIEPPGLDRAPTGLNLGRLRIGGRHTKPSRALVGKVVRQVDGATPAIEAGNLRTPLLQQTRESEAEAAGSRR